MPEARAALQQLKLDVAQSIQGHSSSETREMRSEKSLGTAQAAITASDAMTTREAGLRGGPVGAEMVRRMVALAKAELTTDDKRQV